jgi:glycosyltransferase involved in cell wall biosynthesis
MAAPSQAMRVLVVLPRALDAAAWPRRFAQGTVPDRTPYGYHFAEEFGAQVTFCRPTRTWSGLAGMVDKALRRVLGFDFRHIWHNRRLITGGQFDVVWTHTEGEHLAIAALARLGYRVPAVIGQSIWLCDEWARMSALRRRAFRSLWRHAAVASFHSPCNADYARQRVAGIRTEVVKFGISLDSFPFQAPRSRFASGRPLRLLALGNDRHRDWVTLAAAFGDRPQYELRVGSAAFPATLQATNLHAGPMSQPELRQAYDWADCLLVPLRPNLHASGITAILEAVALGVPVVASDVGGLSAYFDADAVCFVPALDADALRAAVQGLADDPANTLARALRAQQAMQATDLTTRGYAHRHVELSRQLLAARGVATPA